MAIKVSVDGDGKPTNVRIPEEMKKEIKVYILAYNDALEDMEISRKKDRHIGYGIARRYVEDYWKIKDTERFYKMVKEEIT